MTVMSLEVPNPKRWNYVCLSIFMVHYGLNKIKLAFDAQYKIVVVALHTY